jgi:hypothetical protein
MGSGFDSEEVFFVIAGVNVVAGPASCCPPTSSSSKRFLAIQRTDIQSGTNSDDAFSSILQVL